MLRRASAQGFTLVEMIIAMVVMAILLALAARSYSVWMANSQIRTAADTLAEGLSVARNEAIKRNQQVGFWLMSNLSSGCRVSDTGTSWVASLDNPSSKCNVAISDTLEPFIVAKKSAAEGTSRVTIKALDSSGKQKANTIIFNGVGRVLLTDQTPIARIDIASSVLPDEQVRVLRIVLSTGGMIRTCDPSITTSGDTRKC